MSFLTLQLFHHFGNPPLMFRMIKIQNISFDIQSKPSQELPLINPIQQTRLTLNNDSIVISILNQQLFPYKVMTLHITQIYMFYLISKVTHFRSVHTTDTF